ncbi:MAG: PGF-pre-PGF domain-containing protein, partial [Methanosarcinaceae archaeon]
DDLKNSTIHFKVEKKWVSENGGDKDRVVLMRFHDIWEILKTTFEGEDGDYYYFNAITPGFSTFAIGMADTAVVEDTKPVTQPDVIPDADVPEEEVEEKESSGILGFVVIIGILGIIVAILVRRNKDKD